MHDEVFIFRGCARDAIQGRGGGGGGACGFMNTCLKTVVLLAACLPALLLCPLHLGNFNYSPGKVPYKFE